MLGRRIQRGFDAYSTVRTLQSLIEKKKDLQSPSEPGRMFFGANPSKWTADIRILSGSGLFFAWEGKCTITVSSFSALWVPVGARSQFAHLHPSRAKLVRGSIQCGYSSTYSSKEAEGTTGTDRRPF